MPKIDIPLGLNGELDKTDESKKLSDLIYKSNRTNSGQVLYISKTSGIEYNTESYPDDEDIYNKGEVGLIHLFWKLLGGPDGFIIMAKDFNDLKNQINSNLYDFVLLKSGWESYENNKFRQLITIPNIKNNSKVDFNADIDTVYNIPSPIIPENVDGVLYATTKSIPDFDVNIQILVNDIINNIV